MKLKKKIFIGLVTILSTILFGLIGYLFILLAGHYVIDDQKLVMDATTSLVDEEGDLVTKLYVENREIISLVDVPQHVQDAFIAIEDARFYEHQGIDFRAIGRALYRDILAGAKVEGGSTITQQLAKNVFLTHDKSWLRKTKEVLIAINLERRYSKNEILEMYLNRIYFGHGAHGIQAASKLYFDKEVNDLTVEEGALLAGLPKGPNAYSPINNPERSKQRRDLVLSVMERQGYLRADEAVRLQGKTVQVELNEVTENEAYLTYIDMVIDEAEARFGLSNEEFLTGGYKVVVPIDRDVQEASFKLMRNDQYYPNGNKDAEAAYVLMDTNSGGVLAVQGGREYVRLGLNRVNVKRQPGSTFKPLAVYAPALEEGDYHPYSLLKDEQVSYDGYTPRNSNQQYMGKMTMYDAITHSANAPAVWLLNELGVDRALSYLERQGFTLPDKGLALALGGLETGVTPFELAKAYGSLANGGKEVNPYFIEEIYDRNGNKLEKPTVEEEKIFSPQTAWSMTRMLESVVKEGTGQQANGVGALAGKTGTTSYTTVDDAAMDAWFVGYTPEVVGALWMGYDVTSEDRYLRGGSSYPAALFRAILDEGPQSLQASAFQKPNGVEELLPPVRLVTVDDLTATLTMGGSRLMSIKLEWSGSEDERLNYDIYEINGDRRKKVGTIAGEEEYLVSSVNVFSLKEYQVVPHDPLTGQEGEPSNIADVNFRLGFN
ncbi:transglycosylase domain-containing protein [Halalkalibacterium ligniniphilum]|uniref:transglycosylase domain-containing protein n=2 Tax=Halalkalibacterium ligniniphilum TaxID=1134413 RepID=UPI0003460BDB|nr:PBP1A family penicillin-binding protein [Halalkalibacterium ligniniphilum]